MNKKDFELAAKVLKTCRNVGWIELVGYFIEAFKGKYPRFDPIKFKKAVYS